MVKVCTKGRVATLTETSYACDECGGIYSDRYQAELCEKKHVRARCPHASLEWVPDSDGNGIDRACPACGLWFDDGVRLEGLPHDQEILQGLVDAIRAARDHHARRDETAIP
jgi:DNA-directed RNA polymerase subunit RPC12/RpoP